jgi:hypothetical protein
VTTIEKLQARVRETQEVKRFVRRMLVEAELNETRQFIKQMLMEADKKFEFRMRRLREHVSREVAKQKH